MGGQGVGVGGAGIGVGTGGSGPAAVPTTQGSPHAAPAGTAGQGGGRAAYEQLLASADRSVLLGFSWQVPSCAQQASVLEACFATALHAFWQQHQPSEPLGLLHDTPLATVAPAGDGYYTVTVHVLLPGPQAHLLVAHLQAGCGGVWVLVPGMQRPVVAHLHEQHSRAPLYLCTVQTCAARYQPGALLAYMSCQARLFGNMRVLWLGVTDGSGMRVVDRVSASMVPLPPCPIVAALPPWTVVGLAVGGQRVFQHAVHVQYPGLPVECFTVRRVPNRARAVPQPTLGDGRVPNPVHGPGMRAAGSSPVHSKVGEGSCRSGAAAACADPVPQEQPVHGRPVQQPMQQRGQPMQPETAQHQPVQPQTAQHQPVQHQQGQRRPVHGPAAAQQVQQAMHQATHQRAAAVQPAPQDGQPGECTAGVHGSPTPLESPLGQSGQLSDRHAPVRPGSPAVQAAHACSCKAAPAGRRDVAPSQATAMLAGASAAPSMAAAAPAAVQTAARSGTRVRKCGADFPLVGQWVRSQQQLGLVVGHAWPAAKQMLLPRVVWQGGQWEDVPESRWKRFDLVPAPASATPAHAAVAAAVSRNGMALLVDLHTAPQWGLLGMPGPDVASPSHDAGPRHRRTAHATSARPPTPQRPRPRRPLPPPKRARERGGSGSGSMSCDSLGEYGMEVEDADQHDLAALRRGRNFNDVAAAPRVGRRPGHQ